jgi:hypothetical protein
MSQLQEVGMQADAPADEAGSLLDKNKLIN